MDKQPTVNQSISYENSSFFIIEGNKIAIAEISLIDLNVAQSYLSASEAIEQHNQTILKTVNNSKSIYFFNRLNVPKEMQNKGYGKLLMKELMTYLSKNDKCLINTASAYGEMSQDDLIDFYTKSGMKLINREGLFIYHKDIEDMKITLNSDVESQKKLKV